MNKSKDTPHQERIQMIVTNNHNRIGLTQKLISTSQSSNRVEKTNQETKTADETKIDPTIYL